MDYHYSDNYAKQRKPGSRGEFGRSAAVVTSHSSAPTSHVEAESTQREYIKFGGVLLLIAICATVMSGVLGFDWQEWMRWFMGGFFVIFGSFKLIGYEMFVIMFPGYDLIAKRYKLYAYIYPFIELFLGFLYASNLGGVVRDSFTFLLLSVGAYGVFKATSSEAIRCACLGNIIKLPLSTVTLVEDVVMAAMALIMLISHVVL